MQRLPHVEAVHDLHTWTVSDGMNYLSCHVVVDEVCTMPQCSTLIHALNEMLSHDFGIAHATIQTELSGDCVGLSEQDPLFCGEAVATDKAEPSHP